MTTNNIAQQLLEPFPPEMEKVVSKSGTKLIYIPVSEVINRLNKVLGIENWSYSVVNFHRDQIDPDYCIAHIVLTANINGEKVVRDGLGGQKILRTRNGDILDLGNDMKGAVSDALKKAAQTLGVGLYLSRSEEAMEIEEVMGAVAAPVSEEEKERLSRWDEFASITKTLNADQKSSLNAFWDDYSDGKPKPTKSTASLNEINSLIEEAVKISFGKPSKIKTAVGEASD
jgi:recombination DNA repair RAD52 pathway protein